MMTLESARRGAVKRKAKGKREKGGRDLRAGEVGFGGVLAVAKLSILRAQNPN